MVNNLRSATLKPTIDRTAIIDPTQPDFYSPTSRGGSCLQDGWPSSAYGSEDGVCFVADTEGSVQEIPSAAGPDEVWEGDWSEAEGNYATASQEEAESQHRREVVVLQTVACPWIVHVPRMEREINNAFARLGRAPTDCELSEWMGLEGMSGLSRLFYLLEDIGGTVCTQRRNACCTADLVPPAKSSLHSLRFRAMRAELQKVLRDAMSAGSSEDNLHMSLHYRDEPRRESATLEVFAGHPSEGDVLLDIHVYAHDRVRTDQEPDSEKLFQIETSASQNGALRNGQLWERYHDNVRVKRNIISWYWLRSSRPPVRWQREINYHVAVLSK